ncbi:hypothetical protein [Butyricimonas virosa]|nr:hypothetical protein [Butyricimonas virosa]
MRKPGIFPPVWLYASVAREKALYSSTAMRTGQRYPDPANVRPASDPAE